MSARSTLDRTLFLSRLQPVLPVILHTRRLVMTHHSQAASRSHSSRSRLPAMVLRDSCKLAMSLDLGQTGAAVGA